MGYDGNTTHSDLWEYDPLTNQWQQKTGYTSGRRAAAAFAINGKGYIAGGLGASGLLDELIEYDPATDQWTSKAVIPGGARYGAAGFSIGNKGYICCGNMGNSSGPFTDQLLEYDPITDAWQQKQSFTGNARYQLTNAEFVIGSKAYIGTGGTDTSQYKDMYSYDQATDSWTAVSDYPGAGSAYLTGFSICNYGYLGGGKINSDAQSDFWKYNPGNNTWTQIQDFTAGIRWLATASENNNSAYIGTGYDFQNYYNDWWEFKCDDVGLAEINNPDLIVCSPNPTAGNFTVQLSPENKNAGLVIYDLNGKTVKSVNNISGISVVDANELINGIYFVRLFKSGVPIATEKLVIAKD
jgi:hypothetical protein